MTNLLYNIVQILMLLSVIITLWGLNSVIFSYIYTNQTYIIPNWQIFLIGFFYSSVVALNLYILDTYPLFNCSNYYGYTFFIGKLLQGYFFIIIMIYYACNLQNTRLRTYKLLVKYGDTPQTFNMCTFPPEHPQEAFLTFVFAGVCGEIFFYIYCYFFDVTYVFLFFF